MNFRVKLGRTALACVALLSAVAVRAEPPRPSMFQVARGEFSMELKRAGSRPTQKGPAEWFTGEVTIEPLNNPPEPSRIGVASVMFQPGARTAWHTHPLGQTLIVTSGTGWTQCEGEER